MLRLFAAGLLLIAGSACAGRSSDSEPRTAAASSGPHSFAIYALSRGKGVPEAARSVLDRARSLLEDLEGRGAEMTVTQQRIGLEGETRLCATFADPSLAEETLARLRRLVSGIDLVNLVEEPCAAERNG